MRAAAKLKPFHATMFSPPFLIRRPAPSPRSSHAMRLVISNAPSTVWGGLTAATTHSESFCLSPVGHASQLPMGPPPPPPPEGGGATGCGAVWNDRISDHGPLVVGSNARTCQKRTLLKAKSD